MRAPTSSRPVGGFDRQFPEALRDRPVRRAEHGLGALCAAIEQAGQDEDVARLATLLPEFELEMASVDAFLGAY